MKGLHTISFSLVMIGAFNWLLVALTGSDIGAYALGGVSSIPAKIVYTLVGLGAVYEIATHKTRCKDCMAAMGQKT